jgi:hypothetical protein
MAKNILINLNTIRMRQSSDSPAFRMANCMYEYEIQYIFLSGTGRYNGKSCRLT